MRLRLIAFLISLGFSAVHAVDNATNHIYSPGNIDVNTADGIVWQVGKPYTVSWATSTTLEYTVALWQHNPGQGSASFISSIYNAVNKPGNTSFTWVCNSGNADLLYSKIFYMEVKSSDLAISSRYFNISLDAVPTLSSSASATSTSAATTASSTAPATSSASAGSSTTDSAALKVGLGVGLGLGIPLVILLAVLASLMVLKRRRQDRTDQKSNPAYGWSDTSSAGHYQTAPYYGATPTVAEMHEHGDKRSPVEAAAERDPAELPTDHYK